MGAWTVSVVIPAHNAQTYVADAVRSALQQTCPPIEVVVIDDGSTDETAAMVASIDDPRVHLIRTENRGVAAARNLGWRRSTGVLIAFLDADDRWFAEKLDVQLAFLKSHPHVGLVGARMRYETPAGKLLLGVTGVAALGPDALRAVRTGYLMPFPISTVVVRRDVLEHVGGFDEELRQTFPGQVEDIDFVSRASRVTGVAAIPEVLGAYRLHGASATATYYGSQRAGVRFVRERLRARDAGRDLDAADFLASYRPTLRQRWGDAVAAWYRRAGVSAAQGRRAEAAFWMLAATFLGPRYTLRRLARQRPWMVLCAR